MTGERSQDKMSSKSHRSRKSSSISRKLLAASLCLAMLPIAEAHTYYRNRATWKPNWDPNRPVRKGPPKKRDGGIPLVVSNMCPETIWPGIGTQAGTGAGVGGFALQTGESKSIVVSLLEEMELVMLLEMMVLVLLVLLVIVAVYWIVCYRAKLLSL